MSGEFIGNIKDPETICGICGEREGSIKIKDCVVCDRCMPKDMMDRHSSLKKDWIISYRKNNPGWSSLYDHVNDYTECDTCGTPYASDESFAFIGNNGTILADELNREILAAERIDMVVSFIKSSGLDLLFGSLKKFTKDRRLRIITTTYLGATEADAIYRASCLPNTEIKIEYAGGGSRLHAKSFLFRRSDGGSVAYVGSANISRAALTEGEEWVVRLTEKDVPNVIRDLTNGFEKLWISNTFNTFTENDLRKLSERLNRGG